MLRVEVFKFDDYIRNFYINYCNYNDNICKHIKIHTVNSCHDLRFPFVVNIIIFFNLDQFQQQIDT